MLRRHFSTAASGTVLLCAVALGFDDRRSAPPSSEAMQRVDAALQKKMSLQSDRGDLNKALETVSRQIDVPISFERGDIQRDGITKHSNPVFDEPEQPAGQLLYKLLLKTNLDRRLIYVIRPGPDGRGEIVVCTRSGAKLRHETVPKIFDIKTKP